MTEDQKYLLKELSISDLGYILNELRGNLRDNRLYIPSPGLEADYTPEQQRNLDIINYCSKAALIVQEEIHARMDTLFGPHPEIKRIG